MEIQILELIEGARKAEGLTVVIDVFRAFSLECFLYDRGAVAAYIKKKNPQMVSLVAMGNGGVATAPEDS